MPLLLIKQAAQAGAPPIIHIPGCASAGNAVEWKAGTNLTDAEITKLAVAGHIHMCLRCLPGACACSHVSEKVLGD